MEQSQTRVRPTVSTRRRPLSRQPLRRARNTLLCGALALALIVSQTAADAPPDTAFDRFRIIAERNMFGRHRGAEGQSASPAEPAAPPVPADIRLVGIVRASNPLDSIAIIEEGGRHRLCRVGDRVGVLILRSIRDHDIVFETPGGHWLAEIQPGTTLPAGAVPHQPAPSAGFVEAARPFGADPRPRLPVRAVDIKRLARTGLVAYQENGVVKGLQLTHDAMGLKQGDRVTHVAGQALSGRRPRQKLWQIVHKHAVTRRRPAEIHVVVERNHRTIEFLVTPVG